MESEVDKFFDELNRDAETKPFEDVGSQDDFLGKKTQESEFEKQEADLPFHKHPKFREMKQELKELRKLRETPQNKTPEKSFDEDDMPSEWVELYGATEESKRAWKIQQKRELELEKRAEDRAYQRLQQEIENQKKMEREFEEYIAEQIEDIEEKYNVDLSSKDPVVKRRKAEFLELVAKLSPKDTNGVITAYADFNTAWELFQQKKSPAQNSKAKELASLSMNRSESFEQKQDRDESWSGVERFFESLKG